ncbi:hypothetical protein BH10PLA1_BH10PLA1_02280 [soil metagenome]
MISLEPSRLWKFFTAADREFMVTMATDVLAASRIEPGDDVLQEREGKWTRHTNTLLMPVVRPDGRDLYPGFWVQDFAMGYASGCIPVTEGWQHLEWICRTQNGPGDLRLTSGAEVPAWSIADHINLDGTAVYFPGTYAADDTQGGEPWGIRPPVNNHFDFIWLMWMLVNDGISIERLREPLFDVPLIDRLERAFATIETEPKSGLVVTTPETRRVGMIFYDTVRFTNRILTASILRYRAALQMADLLEGLGRADDAAAYANIARGIAYTIGDAFKRDDLGGWLAASTGASAQADVWGTLMAVHFNLLHDSQLVLARAAILAGLRERTIVHQAAVRHVPLDRDASAKSAWEQTPTPHNRYQNGAFWHTATGWLLDAIVGTAPDRTAALGRDFVTHLRQHDFRKGLEFGAPWECIGPVAAQYRGPTFHPSLTQTLSVLRYGVNRSLPAAPVNASVAHAR